MSWREEATRSRALGLLVLAGWATHATAHVLRGTSHSLLWSCNLGALLVGLGLLAARPRLSGIGLLWVALGTPVWMVSVSLGRGFLPSSLLTHFGALAAGLAAGARALPAGAWKPAWVGLAALHALGHWAAPDGASLNLSGMSLGAAGQGHLVLVAACAAASGLLLPLLERGLRAALRSRAGRTASRAASGGSTAPRTPARRSPS